MTDEAPPADSSRATGRKQTGTNEGTAPATSLPREQAVTTSTEVKAVLGQTLTAAEQMALYEKDLQENDWGHQPC